MHRKPMNHFPQRKLFGFCLLATLTKSLCQARHKSGTLSFLPSSLSLSLSLSLLLSIRAASAVAAGVRDWIEAMMLRYGKHVRKNCCSPSLLHVVSILGYIFCQGGQVKSTSYYVSRQGPSKRASASLFL
jgi:hypothetical protein